MALRLLSLPLLALALTTPAPAQELNPADQRAPVAPRAVPFREAIEFELLGTCVQKQQVYRGLRYWLKTDELDSSLAFSVRAGESEGGPWAEFLLRRDGTVAVKRELTGAESCTELAQALVLTMAIAVDGSVLDRTAEGRPDLDLREASQRDPSEPLRAEESVPARRGSQTVSAPRGRARHQVDVGLSALGGVLPEVTGAVDARWGIAFDSGSSLHVGGLYGFGQEFSAQPARGAASLLGGRLEGCVGGHRSAKVTANGCALLLAAWVPLEGRDADDNSKQDAALVSGGLGGGITVTSGSAFLRGEAGALVHLLRPRLIVEQGEEPRATSWPLVGGLLGLRFGFVL